MRRRRRVSVGPYCGDHTSLQAHYVFNGLLWVVRFYLAYHSFPSFDAKAIIIYNISYSIFVHFLDEISFGQAPVMSLPLFASHPS